MQLTGKTALITGAGGALGTAMVEALLASGAARIIALDKNETHFNDERVSKLVCDITNADETTTTISQALSSHTKLDILINNAGILHSAPLVNLLEKDDKHLAAAAAEWNNVISTNLSSAFFVTQIVARHMARARTKGIIINISSVCASGNAGQSAYSASKAGLNALTHVWAKELGAFGIRSVAIAPGYVDTPSTRAAISDAQLQSIAARIPLRTLGTTEAITQAMLFAIANDYLTGTVLEIDGGLDV